VFGTFDAREWPWEPIDHSLSETVSSYWVNFARTGNPNGAGLPQWDRFNPVAPRVMFLREKIGVGDVPYPERLAFWDAFYSRQPKSLSEHLSRRIAA
jgi:para-nitrobenzyl esterase